MTFAEPGESRAWSCFWVVTAGSSRTRGRWFCMEAPSSDSAYCFGFFLLYIQIFVTELFKRDRLGTVRWGGRRTVPLTAFHVWSSPLPQHRACPGFQRPPAEDNEEAGRRAETQGRRELPELPCWVSPAAVVSLPFFFFLLPFSQLCFALSMLGNPRVTLLDEPSTGMDPKAKQHMWWVSPGPRWPRARFFWGMCPILRVRYAF